MVATRRQRPGSAATVAAGFLRSLLVAVVCTTATVLVYGTVRVSAAQHLRELATLAETTQAEEESAASPAEEMPPATEPAAISDDPAWREARFAGMKAGHALANERSRRNSRRPTASALDALVQLRSEGQPPGFAEGFRRGFSLVLDSRDEPPAAPASRPN